MRWDELSRAEAAEHLRAVVEHLPVAIRRLEAEIGRGVRLDLGRRSLDRVWKWSLKRRNDGGVPPADDASMPPWYPYRHEFCEQIGVERSLVLAVDGMAAHLAACIGRAQPARQWRVGGDARDTAYAFYNAPVYGLDGHDLAPYIQLLSLVANHRRPRRRGRRLGSLTALYDDAIATGGSG